MDSAWGIDHGDVSKSFMGAAKKLVGAGSSMERQYARGAAGAAAPRFGAKRKYAHSEGVFSAKPKTATPSWAQPAARKPGTRGPKANAPAGGNWWD